MKADNKIAKWFVRVICGVILLAYMTHIIQVKVIERHELNLNADDWGILGVSMGIWIAYESVVAFLKKKAGN